MKPAFKLATALTGMVLLAGCAGIREHRGHVLDAELAAAVQPGVDNKTSVTSTLGRPSFVSQFNENEWYYVARDTTTLAFRDPRVTDQTVLKVSFDAAGNVASVQKTGEELIANIDPSGGKTPTAGRKRSLFDELFGNVGTISQGGLPGGGGPSQ